MVLMQRRNKTEHPVVSEPTSKRRRLKRWGIIAVVCVLVIAMAGKLFARPKGRMPVDSVYQTAQVERRDINSSITGSGTLAAANSYSVTSLVGGSILSDTFEEGDRVEQDTALYTIDSSDQASSLEQAQISLDQAQRNYNSQLENQGKLTITAPISGQVVSLSVKKGDQVSAGQTVAAIRDASVMKLTVPFPSDDAAGFYVGQSAQIMLAGTFETLSGTVTEVNAADTVLTGNMLVRSVTIETANPGGLSTTQTATATVGDATSTDSGTFTYREERTVTAEVSGKVSALSTAEGWQISSGQAIAVLDSSDMDNAVQSAYESVRNAQLSLETQSKQLEDYTITSPISGTVVDKNVKAGEKAEANKVLCTIYDLSYLTMTLNVDELDISNIQVGQSVAITADAVKDKTYRGTVTKVSVAGTSSGSATTYPVTIRIDETDGLLPGMSVDASIELDSASDVLSIPAAALSRGNTVLVTADSPSATNGTPAEEGGYVSVPVTVGVISSDYVEITSGLQEGDTVAYIPTSSSGDMFFPGDWGGGGEMYGPGGGMGGF